MIETERLLRELAEVEYVVWQMMQNTLVWQMMRLLARFVVWFCDLVLTSDSKEVVL